MAQSYRTIAGRDSTHEAFDDLAQGFKLLVIYFILEII